MNAFHPAEVTRALDLATALDLLPSSSSSPRAPANLLYLTGAVREPGLAFARDKGVRVMAVGHRVCEEWGIGFLAERLRETWPGGLRVVEVYEEEEEEAPHETGDVRPGGGGERS
ncbi:Glycoside hydrolase [Teratosphaeria destructans]|uniref:Glycoside hydrolase n=1 Tax=Teratosphaeria destructans TaxID=418781 RepID=A0A9W7W5W2_9PEZI|nr:Glycoside hydrolase [Teratosphaeria destructans]